MFNQSFVFQKHTLKISLEPSNEPFNDAYKVMENPLAARYLDFPSRPSLSCVTDSWGLRTKESTYGVRHHIYVKGLSSSLNS